MDLMLPVLLLVFTFGIYAFGSMFVLTLRSLADPDVRSGFHADRAAASVTLAMLFVCCAWFVVQVMEVLARVHPALDANVFDLARLVMAYLFPPLIMLVTYMDVAARGACPSGDGTSAGRGHALRHAGWRWSIVAVAVPCVFIPVYALLAMARVVVVPEWLDLGALIGYSIALGFTLTAVYCTLAMYRGRTRRETREERAGRRWTIVIYALLILFCVAVTSAVGKSTWSEFLGFAGGSIPLMFVFVSLYHEARFRFIDLFVKGGLFLALTLGLLGAFFTLVAPRLGGFEPPEVRPWIHAVALLPLAAALPWLYRRLAQWIDARWLGRRLTTVEAIERFLSDLGHAATERELCDKAERGLSVLFQARVRVRLGLEPAHDDDLDGALEVPVVSEGRPVGALIMGRRANHLPYFSQDATLLDSLSGVFSNLLENLRLQQRRLEQDRQARELTLQASRSELKALRAQINPHFLFNALNAIAGLIHEDPLRADRTVEQLSEIFRYTLRGSESEWATLEQELDFVSAYLEVEKARFGRLQVRVTAAPDARQARVPTMLVHTLVENAVKHGITRMRGPAQVEVEARREADRLIVEVRDNGPGPAEDPTPRSETRRGGAGYGLRHVRERLAGHFGDRAGLEFGRDETRRVTVAAITMPFLPLRPSADGVA